MKYRCSYLIKLIFGSLVLLILSSCGGSGISNNSNDETPADDPVIIDPVINNLRDFSGVAQKGPFSPDSEVIIEQLSSRAKPGNRIIKTKTSGSASNYSYKLPEDWQLEGQQFPVSITVIGSYVDEVSGKVSRNKITLSALLAKPSNASINLLTHWSSTRAKVLMFEKGLSVSDALKQAYSELHGFTGIDHIAELDISQNDFDTSDNSQLLLLSGALLEVAKEYDSSSQEVINQISADFAVDGALDDQGKDWFKRIQAKIRTNPQQNNNQYAKVLNDHLGKNSISAAPSGDLLPSLINIAARPQAIAPEIIFAQPGETVTLDGSESHDNDDGGEIINSTWFRIDQQTEFVVPISDRFSANPTIVAPNQESEILFALIVTNTEKLTDTTIVKVIVRIPEEVNQTPVGDSQSVITNEDTPVDIVITASDADGDVLSFDVGTTPLLLQHGILNGTAPNLRYTPEQDYFGPDSFTFTASDASSTSERETVDITVLPINDKPIADPKSITTNEDTSESVTLSGSDVENDPLIFSIVTLPQNGSLDISSLPNVIYTPDNGYTGEDEFTYQANDGQDLSDPAPVDITVLPVNGKPLAFTQTVVTNQDTPKSIFLDGRDPDGDQLTYIIVTQPNNGTLTGLAPNLVYRPNPGYSGLDGLTFKVNDGELDSNVTTVAISVIPVDPNAQPKANPQSLTTAKNTALNISLTGTDADGDSLNFVIFSGPFNGALSGTAPNITYTPNPNFTGSDFFFFAVNDGQVFSDLAMVDISVTNTPPIAVASASPNPATSGETVTLDGSLSNDPNGDSLTYKWIQTAGPTIGSFAGTTVSPVIMAPTVTTVTNIAFSLVVNDGTDNSNADIVTITVNPANQVPVADNQSVTVDEDSSANPITLTGSDADGDTLVFTVLAQPANGTLSGTAPNLTYTPNANFAGSDSFTFKVNDGTEDSNTATVSITVTDIPENTPPIANDQSVTVDEDTSANAITLTGSDADGDTLVFTVLAQPANGTLSGTAPNLTYTPNANFAGSDSFTFKVNDGTEDSNTATVSITVTDIPENTPPVANDQSVTVDEDTSANAITLTGSDADGDTLVFTVLAQPANGTLSGTAPNLTYTPNANFAGSDSFTFKVNDGTEDSNTATVSITVIDIPEPNLPPVAVAGGDFVALHDGETADIKLDGSGSFDPEGGPLTYLWRVISSPVTITLTDPKNPLQDFNVNFDGVYEFELTVTDNTGQTDTDTIVVTVEILPFADGQTVFVGSPSSPTIITLVGIDLDGDNNNLIYEIVSGPSNGMLDDTGILTDNIVGYTPTASPPVADSFTFRVRDEQGHLSGIATVDLIVNRSPIANAGSSQTIVLQRVNLGAGFLEAAGPIMLDASGSSDVEDGTNLIYTWTQIEGPVTIDPTDEVNPTFTIAGVLNQQIAGRYSFLLEVTDRHVPPASSQAIVSIFVIP